MYWTCPVLLGDPLNQNDPNFMWLEVGGFFCAPRNLGYPWSQDIHENRISHGYRDCYIFLYMFPIWWLNSPTLLVCSRRQDPHAIAIRRQQRLRHAMVWFGWKMYRDTWMMYCVCIYIVLVCLGCCVDLFVCVLICWLCTYVKFIDWFSDARFRHTSTFEIVFTRVGYVWSLQEILRYDKIIVPTPLPLSGYCNNSEKTAIQWVVIFVACEAAAEFGGLDTGQRFQKHQWVTANVVVLNFCT